MSRPNTDPLLEPRRRMRKDAAKMPERHDQEVRKDIGSAADTLFKGTPPPKPEGRADRDAGEPE